MFLLHICFSNNRKTTNLSQLVHESWNNFSGFFTPDLLFHVMNILQILFYSLSVLSMNVFFTDAVTIEQSAEN